MARGPSLILVDNLGVATSSLNALAFSKTVIQRLCCYNEESADLILLSTSHTDLLPLLSHNDQVNLIPAPLEQAIS